MTYRFQLEHFEGPLDLLLSLIEREKLDITTVSLAQITDQYLAYLSQERQVTLENLTSFLSVASRLLLIKSRALLPILSFTEEEESEVANLEWQLFHYKRFRDAALTLGTLFSARQAAFARESFLGSRVVFYPPKCVSRDDLAHYFRSLLGNIPIDEEIPEAVVVPTVSLEDRIVHLQQHLTSRIETSFSVFLSPTKNKSEVIISFLALLELIKQCFLIAEQQSVLHDIRLRRIESVSADPTRIIPESREKPL